MCPASGDTRVGEKIRAELRGVPLELVLVDTYSPHPGGADAAERGYNPRLVLLALAMGGFAIGTNEFAAMALLPYFSTDLGVDKATASQAISAYALGVVVGAPLLAVLGARLPRRNMLIGLMLAYGIANIVVACSVSYHMMLIARFFCGLPHGAFFGVGSLLAASVVPRGKRTQAVARMMVGLTVATILGVPMANLLGEFASWRLGFGLVGVLAAICGVMVFMFAPRDRGDAGARPLRELSALGNRQVLLLTATGCVGFGGFFAIYTYMANMLVEVTHIDAVAVPVVLALFGVGMTVGTLAAGWAADRKPAMTCFGIMGLSVVLSAIYPSVTHNI
ncbi:MFS transporter, partial [Thioclava sp. BHET1]